MYRKRFDYYFLIIYVFASTGDASQTFIEDNINHVTLSQVVGPVKTTMPHACATTEHWESGAKERRLRVLESQSRVLESVARNAPLDRVLDQLALAIEEVFDDAVCGLFTLESHDTALRLAAGPNVPEAYKQTRERFSLQPRAEPSAAAVRRREPVVVGDVATDPLWADLRAVLPPELRAIWAHPILNADGAALGALTLYFGDATAPDHDDCRTIDAFLLQARLAIEHDRRARALSTADERLTSLAASIPGVVYQRKVTPDGDIRYTYISEGAKDLFGVSPQEILANPQALFDCHGPEYRATFRERLLEASRKLEMWDVEAQIITRDGEEKWTHAIARPHRQPDGSVLWDGVILDATRAKMANLELSAANREKADLLEALHTAYERFASLTASIPGVVYQRKVTPDGDIRYTYISEGAKDLFGVSPQEILADSQALFDCHGPEYRATFRERLLEASRKLEIWDVEAQIITRDGEEKWTHAIARPHLQADGTVVWDGVILDATRIKMASRAAAAASRAKSEFLANMSHELRTPLNAIIGFSDVIASESFGKLGHRKYLEYARDIGDSGKHLLEIINDVLDLSKIEADKLELNEETIDLRRVIRGCVRLVKSKADENRISLDVNIPDDVPWVRADERKLKQILVNLLSNAVKFTPPAGAVDVTVALDADGQLSIAVSDNGPGIAPKHLDAVLDPFAQVDSGLNRKFEGTGLGLPLSRAMAERHGGTLELRSELDKGTTAIVRLPSYRVCSEPTTQAPKLATGSGGPAA